MITLLTKHQKLAHRLCSWYNLEIGARRRLLGTSRVYDFLCVGVISFNRPKR